MNINKDFNPVFGSPEMYRRLVENLHAGIYVADAVGKLIYVNQSFTYMLGYTSKDEIVGLNLADHFYVHPEDRQKFLEKISKIGFVRNYEIEYKRKDGATMVFAVTGDLIFDEHNEVAGVEGVVYDITEQKKILRRLTILEKAVEQTADNIMITDKAGVIQYVNPAFETTTGYSFSDVVGFTPKVLFSGHHPHEFYRNLWSMILSGHVFSARITNKKKNGEYYVSDVTISPIVNEFRQVTHFVSTYKDVMDWMGSKSVEDLPHP